MSEGSGDAAGDLVIRKLLYWLAQGLVTAANLVLATCNQDPNWTLACCRGFHLEQSPAESAEDVRLRHLRSVSSLPTGCFVV